LSGSAPLRAAWEEILQPEPQIAEQVVWSESLTDYDLAHLTVYLRLLDAEQDGADWREAAQVVLGQDAQADPARARRCWESHLERARWMTRVGYKLLLNDPGRAPLG